MSGKLDLSFFGSDKKKKKHEETKTQDPGQY